MEPREREFKLPEVKMIYDSLKNVQVSNVMPFSLQWEFKYLTKSFKEEFNNFTEESNKIGEKFRELNKEPDKNKKEIEELNKRWKELLEHKVKVRFTPIDRK